MSGHQNPIDYSDLVDRSWPTGVRERAHWMPTDGDSKMPFAKYVDHPAASYYRDLECRRTDSDPRRSWSDPSNWRPFGVVDEWVSMDPTLAGRAFIMQRDGDPYRQGGDTDPYLFVDGDNVRDPETGAVIPEFPAMVERLTGGEPTFQEVSQSDAGAHALVEGKLPEGTRTKYIKLRDEPVFGHDEPPMLELYEGPKVAVLTGRRVGGTPEEIAPVDPDGLDHLLDKGTDAHPNVLAAAAKRSGSGSDGVDVGDHEHTPSIEATSGARLPADAPDGLPACYDRALRARAGDPEAVEGVRMNAHGVNLIASNLAIHAGYDVETAVGHFAEFAPARGSFNRSITRKSLKGTRQKVEKGDLHPPTGETLREIGLFRPDEACSGECPIHGGGSTDHGDDVEHVAILPHSPRARAAVNGWDWRSADRVGTALTIDDARDRTSEAIGDAYESGDRALVEALPTMGKSHGAIKAAAETGAPITVLAGRGNKEQYQQYEQWCEEYGLRAKVLPSVHRDCETFKGDHGESIEETVKDWYRRGATGKDIHKDAEFELGKPLPCDGPAGQRCSYKVGWEFDADEYDVLIGNYLHAHVGSATQGRTVVVDEFPGDAYETVLGGSPLASAVTQFVQHHDAIPFDDHADLLENRRDARRRADTLAWFTDHEPERDGTLAFASTKGHAAAPLATFTILAAAENDLGNGWERAPIPGFDGAVGLYDRENECVHLHTPPDLRYTRGVVGLDGTPTPVLWEIAMGTRLNHRQVLTDDERAEYVRDTLGVNIVRTTDAVKPYSGSSDHVAVSQDRALLEAIGDEHDAKPSLLTTKTAELVYRDEGVLDAVRDVDHYGNLKGSNQRASTRLGAVIGSRNFGDQFVKKWGAFVGEAVAEPDRSSADTRGANLSYGGGVGDDVLQHMREHETLQAVMRFGRDGRGATVYVHTNTLPAWIEEVLAGEGRVIQTWSDGMCQVLDVARDLGANGEGWTTAEIADHPTVEIGEWQVRDHLHKLAKRGYVAVETEGNGFVWHDDGLHRVGEHGDVELAPVDLEKLSEQETGVVSRSVTYTWDHASSSPSSKGSAAGSNSADGSAFVTGANGGDRTLHDG